jgi:hypothetical protein
MYKKTADVLLERNIEARSHDHCCHGKAMGITYSECVFVLLIIQHAKRVRHIVICGLSGCTKFFPHDLINSKIFGKGGKKLLNIKHMF